MLKRYDIDDESYVDVNGYWVKYHDVKELEAELTTLKQHIDILTDTIKCTTEMATNCINEVKAVTSLLDNTSNDINPLYDPHPELPKCPIDHGTLVATLLGVMTVWHPNDQLKGLPSCPQCKTYLNQSMMSKSNE